jgi:hypothetical protein
VRKSSQLHFLPETGDLGDDAGAPCGSASTDEHVLSDLRRIRVQPVPGTPLTSGFALLAGVV